MANPRHVAKLLKGVDAWNKWRKGKEMKAVDLSQLNLSKRDFSGANFNFANLFGSICIETNFRGADFHNANLQLMMAAKADFSRADMFGANLSFINLWDANFSEAIFGGSTIASVNLESVKGLDSSHHRVPSSIGVDTIYMSKGKIPESFLRGCGAPKEFIEYIPSLVGAIKPIELYSVFISYSSKDQAFAERLHADLQSKKVRCWFAPEDLKTGDKFRLKIDEVIRIYDKLLLVLSKNSVGSEWVEKEVESAMERERQQKRPMLFPIRLDDAVMKVETGWPADVRRTRHIGDFQNWKDHDLYQKAFNRLMRDLKADEKISK
jgi:hypothetical protein